MTSKAVLWAALAAIVASAIGCAEGEGISVQDSLKMLERGQARGHLVVTSTESPLSVAQKTRLSLGPEVTVAFDGDVDYANPLLRKPVAEETAETPAAAGGAGEAAPEAESQASEAGAGEAVPDDGEPPQETETVPEEAVTNEETEVPGSGK
jgi:hypothetical protein